MVRPAALLAGAIFVALVLLMSFSQHLSARGAYNREFVWTAVGTSALGISSLALLRSA